MGLVSYQSALIEEGRGASLLPFEVGVEEFLVLPVFVSLSQYILSKIPAPRWRSSGLSARSTRRKSIRRAEQPRLPAYKINLRV